MEYDVNQLEVSLSRWMLAEGDGPQVASPGAMVPVFLPLLTDNGEPLDHERLAVAAIGQGMRLIDAVVLTTGSAQFTVLSSAQILRWVLTRARPALGFVIAHNHPGGDPNPSPQDRLATRRLQDAATTLDLAMHDHLIFGSGGRYKSFAEMGLLGPR